MRAAWQFLPLGQYLLLLYLFPDCLFVDRRRMDGLFPWLTTRWLSLENKRGEKSVAELNLCVVCDRWTQTGQNQTVKLLPWFALRRVRVNGTATASFQRLTPSR